MDETELLADLLSRLRAHDEAAAERFVKLYEPVIFHVVGLRLVKRGLSRALAPEDIAQEVFMKFFAWVAQNFEFRGPKELIKLLVTMTNHVIGDEQRHACTLRHGGGKHLTEQAHVEDIASSGEEMSQELEFEEELDEIHKRMSDEEWALAWAWAYGKSWQQLAAEFGQSAEALRKRLNRAFAKVRQDLHRTAATELLA